MDAEISLNFKEKWNLSFIGYVGRLFLNLQQRISPMQADELRQHEFTTIGENRRPMIGILLGTRPSCIARAVSCPSSVTVL